MNKKTSVFIITILIVIIAVMGYFLYKFNNDKNVAIDKANNYSQQIKELEKSDNTDKQDNSVTINDKDLLDKLINIIGATDDDCYDNSLNGYLASYGVNYKRLDSFPLDEIYMLLELYGSENKLFKNVDNSDCINDGASGFCKTITRENLEKFMSLYDFKYTVDEFITNKLNYEGVKPLEEGNYYYITGGDVCEGKATHTVTSWYGMSKEPVNNTKDKNYVTLKDVVDIKYDNGDKSTKTIYFTFTNKDNTTNDYYLYIIDVY